MLPKGLLKEYSQILSVIIRFSDVAAVFFAGWIAFFIRFQKITLSFHYSLAIVVGVFFALMVFSFFNIYAAFRDKKWTHYLAYLFQAMCVIVLLLAGFAFFTKRGETYSRLWFGLWMGITFLFFIGIRFLFLFFLRFMRLKGLNERRVVIFGAGTLGEKFVETVQPSLWSGYTFIAFLDDQAEKKSSLACSIPVIQTPENLNQYLVDKKIDEIWFALPLRAESRVKEVLHELRHQTITTRFVLDIFGLDLLNYSLTDMAGFPVLTIRSSPMVGFNRLIKAIEDRALATFILMLISPLFFLIAIFVKMTSKGPIFFKQYRHGWDGRIIKIYKFRTMIEHDEKEKILTQATPHDKRFTRIGKFLRRTSLDELPQFINVLQGRMSIVGPRPHAISHNEFYKETIHTYMQRHRVKPGITGWAQVNGWRGETDTVSKMQKRIEYDLYYINNWSLKFDLKIIFLTFFRGFIHRNAY